MKITKEIGYELLRVVDMDGFMELWNRTDTETKDKIVNGIGELAVKLVNGVETSNDKCTLHIVSASFLAHLEMQLNYHKKNEQNKREMGDYEKAMYHRDRGGAIEDLIIHIKNAR